MLNYIKRQIALRKREKLTDDELIMKLYTHFNRAYIQGLKARDILEKEGYGVLCEPCGNYFFPVIDERRMRGITVQMGKCPRCKNTATLIPIRDFEYASGYPGVMWD